MGHYVLHNFHVPFNVPTSHPFSEINLETVKITADRLASYLQSQRFFKNYEQTTFDRF